MNGIATFGPFSIGGQDLHYEDYEVDLSAPFTGIQPPNVLAIIGENYSNYVGDAFVTDGKVVYISVEKTLHVDASGSTLDV